MKRTREQELRDACEAAGFTVRTYSPGDGVTRYRFSTIDERSGDYFAMRNEYTALGLKEAWTYAAGRGAYV